jgi:uncharacterized protein
MSLSHNRIMGFDLARAYAIFGMFIVNFNIVFGNHNDSSVIGQFLSAFNGNSSTIFVILAGMGLSLMSNRPTYSAAEKQHLRWVVTKRGFFLFGLGLLLYAWWPADILHFYGGYMKIAALLLFVPRVYLLWTAGVGILGFHLLLFITPFEQGWNFQTLEYLDFWTIKGFLRNTFYNGWNPIFPWVAYFMVGMWLGRLDWSQTRTLRAVGFTGLTFYLGVQILQYWAKNTALDPFLKDYILADYLPPFLPFMASTMGFGCVVICFFVVLGKHFSHTSIAQLLSKTGQMTLTHYIVHLTLGMVILAAITGRPFEAKMSESSATSPIFILVYALSWFVLSLIFSHFWTKKFKNGPFETLMRRFSG